MQPLTLERGCHHTGQTLFGSSRTGRFCGLKATKDKEFAISKIRLFVCMLAVPTGAQEVYKNAPQRSVSVSYSLHFLLKGNRQFLWQLAHGEFQNLTDSDFSKRSFCSDRRLPALRSEQFPQKSQNGFLPIHRRRWHTDVLLCTRMQRRRFFVFVGQLQFHHTENTGIHQ